VVIETKTLHRIIDMINSLAVRRRAWAGQADLVSWGEPNLRAAEEVMVSGNG
jgi:hypothetical protein